MSENERQVDICEACWRSYSCVTTKKECVSYKLAKIVFSIAFAAGEKSQKAKDRQLIQKREAEITQLAKDMNGFAAQLDAIPRALFEAKKQGARELMKWVKTFAFTDPQFVPASGKEAVRVCIPESEWQSKLAELSEE